MNTKFLEAEFDYIKPATLEEALEILATKENVKIFAGGTDLIVKLKSGAPIVMDYMMDVNAIPELQAVTEEADGLHIGATEKISVLEKHPKIVETYPALSHAFHDMASISVRNMATLGGNFCNASPVADAVGPCICYKGQVELQSRNGGTRRVAAEDFFKAPGVTVMEKDELLTSIILPAPAANTGSHFIKMGRTKADIAKISITVVLRREGNTIADCRMAMGSVAARPLFLKEISESLVGKEMTASLIAETAQRISDFIRPIDDNRTTAQYRTDVAAIIARDALTAAWKDCGGDC